MPSSPRDEVITDDIFHLSYYSLKSDVNFGLRGKKGLKSALHLLSWSHTLCGSLIGVDYITEVFEISSVFILWVFKKTFSKRGVG